MRHEPAIATVRLQLVPAMLSQNLQRFGTQLSFSRHIARVIIDPAGAVIDLRIDDHHIVRLIRRHHNQRRGSDLRQRNRAVRGHEAHAAAEALIRPREEMVRLAGRDSDGRRAAHQETSLRLQSVVHGRDLNSVAILSQRPHTVPADRAGRNVLTQRDGPDADGPGADVHRRDQLEAGVRALRIEIHATGINQLNAGDIARTHEFDAQFMRLLKQGKHQAGREVIENQPVVIFAEIQFTVRAIQRNQLAEPTMLLRIQRQTIRLEGNRVPPQSRANPAALWITDHRADRQRKPATSATRPHCLRALSHAILALRSIPRITQLKLQTERLNILRLLPIPARATALQDPRQRELPLSVNRL